MNANGQAEIFVLLDTTTITILILADLFMGGVLQVTTGIDILVHADQIITLLIVESVTFGATGAILVFHDMTEIDIVTLDIIGIILAAHADAMKTQVDIVLGELTGQEEVV